MYGFRLLIEEKLRNFIQTVIRISGVTVVAFSISIIASDLCKRIDYYMTPDLGIPTFLINLDKAVDRLEFFESQLSDYTRFSAVDWREISISEDEEVTKEDPKRMTIRAFEKDDSNASQYIAECLRYPHTKLHLRKKYLRRNDIGCFFSHIALWNECYRQAYNRILVFEDDVVLKPFFRTKLKKFLKRIPQDFDIAFLGYHDDFSFRPKLLSRVGLHAYVINLQKPNLRHFLCNFHNMLPIDYMIGIVAGDFKCYYNKKQILAINEKFKAFPEFELSMVDVRDVHRFTYEVARFFADNPLLRKR